MSFTKRQLEQLEAEIQNKLSSSSIVELIVSAIKPAVITVVKEAVTSALEASLGELAEIRLLKEENADLKHRIDVCEATVSLLSKNAEKMAETVQGNFLHANENEQYSRRTCLRIFSIAEDMTVDRDSITEFFKDKLEVDIAVEDIDRVHRIGKRQQENANKPRAVIVKFTNYKARSLVWRNKSKLKGSQFIILEDLTKYNLNILKEAKQRGSYQSVWTSDGKIFAKDLNGSKRRIHSITDLD